VEVMMSRDRDLERMRMMMKMTKLLLRTRPVLKIERRRT